MASMRSAGFQPRPRPSVERSIAPPTSASAKNTMDRRVTVATNTLRLHPARAHRTSPRVRRQWRPVKVTVDEDRCRGHGMCLTPCPEVFQMHDDGYAVADPSEVPARLEEAARTPSLTALNRPSSKPTESQGDSMPEVYIILTEHVKDPAGMTEYAKLAGMAMAGSTLLSFDQKPEVFQGEWRGTQTVALEFESVEAARICTNRTPTRRRRSCGRPPPTATASSFPGSDPRACRDGVEPLEHQRSLGVGQVRWRGSNQRHHL